MSTPTPDAKVAREHLNEPTVAPADLASLFDIGLPLVYASLHDGTIPSIKLGSRYRVPSSWVRQQLGL